MAPVAGAAPASLQLGHLRPERFLRSAARVVCAWAPQVVQLYVYCIPIRPLLFPHRVTSCHQRGHGDDAEVVDNGVGAGHRVARMGENTCQRQAQPQLATQRRSHYLLGCLLVARHRTGRCWRLYITINHRVPQSTTDMYTDRGAQPLRRTVGHHRTVTEIDAQTISPASHVDNLRADAQLDPIIPRRERVVIIRLDAVSASPQLRGGSVGVST